MHPDEVAVDAATVARLVAAQFPQWAALPVRPVPSTGTVNTIFRIGDELCARLPRLATWVPDLEREWHWLPRLAPRISLGIPEAVARGTPDAAYPFPWAVVRWIPGEPYGDDAVADERAAAAALAEFVGELRDAAPVAGAPPAGRRPAGGAPATGIARSSRTKSASAAAAAASPATASSP